MKKLLVFSACFCSLISQAQTTKIDTVSTAATYTNQIWYSLSNDEVASQPKDNWDLGIEITGFNSSILVNTQKTGVAAYATPYTWTNWSAFDTTGYKKWTALHNSDTMWEIGALNKTGVYDTEDMGWGTYDMSSHAVLGTRLFLLALPGNKFYKLGVKSLIAGTYTITYKSIDGTDSSTFTVSKSNFADRHFAYYRFDTKSLFDREPNKNDWDLTFTKYIYNNYPAGGGQFIPYGVTGILQNKGVKVAELRTVDVAQTNDYMSATYSNHINIIGSDWKTFTGTAFEITDSLVYFVEDIEDNYWKVVMTGFSGSATGNYIFSKQLLSTVGINDATSENRISVYPNPSKSGAALTLLGDFGSENINFQIYAADGKSVYSNVLIGNSSFNAIELPLNLSKGIYFIQLEVSGKITSTKLVIE
ncbi:MAG TPA: T9SS type A sorting domain-containing protein [Bacteroidia bacterium]